MARKALLLGRNDDTSLRWCCKYDPGGGDEHGLAPCDVRKMRDALKACGYEIHVVGPECRTEGQITDTVKEAVRACAEEDQFLFYFSGHARTRNGELELLLTRASYTESFLSSRLIPLLQDCPAATKLLILDTCYAQGVTEVWQPRRYDKLRILVATKTLDRGKEVDGLDGGIFTHCLCEALTEPEHWRPDGPDALIDADGHIYSHNLLRWLKRRIPEVGRRYRPGESFPEPTADAGQDEPFLVASVAIPAAAVPRGLSQPPATGFSPEALAALRALLRDSGLTDAELAQHYREVMSGGGLCAADGYRGPTDAYGAVGLDGALCNLAQAWYRPIHSVKVPLAEFVERIARAATKTNAPELRAWLRDALDGLAAGQDLDGFIASLSLGRSELDRVKGGLKSHLAVALSPCDANAQTQYAVEARLVDAQGLGDSVVAPVESVSTQGMPGIMRRALNQPAVTEAMRADGGPLTIEFFLPVRLLGEDVDDWTPPRSSEQHPPFSERHRVTVRALDRLGLGAELDDSGAGDAEPYIADWAHQWAACGRCRDVQQDGTQPPPCCVWLPAPRASYRQETRRGGCIFVLGFKPTEEDLDLMLHNGLATVLWGSEPLDQGFMAMLMAEVAATYPNSPKRPCLSDLPFALLHLRQDACAQTPGKTGGFHLLWDDPSRIPAFTGRSARATTAQPSLRLRSPF